MMSWLFKKLRKSVTKKSRYCIIFFNLLQHWNYKIDTLSFYLKKSIKEESSIGLYKKLQIYMFINTQKGLYNLYWCWEIQNRTLHLIWINFLFQNKRLPTVRNPIYYSSIRFPMLTENLWNSSYFTIFTRIGNLSLHYACIYVRKQHFSNQTYGKLCGTRSYTEVDYLIIY